MQKPNPKPTVKPVDNEATVRLTEWLILHDLFDEDGSNERVAIMEEFGRVADQAFASHREQAAAEVRAEALKDCAAIVDLALDIADELTTFQKDS